ncbi:HGxxPAAW family protein [Streptomyces sp. AJS327]|uniref:HGxxPAAW family protein n=1 Tax=Streptomyces sp. AJS327 TaxID=2545265 RepID=UPI0021557BBD|nr:HGxxPAAW family protein [Streptomyces sp. AJS327]
MAGSSHGHTPAAWTGVIIAFIGFCVSGMFMVMAQPVGVIGGLVVVGLGGVVGLAMRAAGLGMPKPETVRAGAREDSERGTRTGAGV